MAAGTSAPRASGARSGSAATAPRSGRAPGRRPAGPRLPRPAWLARLESPLGAYFLVLGSTVALVVIGLVMVLSSSSVESLTSTGSSYSVFVKQARFAAIGLPLAWLASRTPIRFWQRLAWPVLAVGTVGLMVVPFVGRSVNGNQNWIAIGGVTVQPSEAVKLALVVWSATVLTRKQPLMSSLAHAAVPVLPVAAFLLLLVLVGHDLGTALIILALVAAVLFTAGAPMALFGLGGAAASLAVAALVVTSSNRMGRLSAWLAGGGTDYYGSDWQAVHGTWALASGGWWGVGLGASREKWLWLPEAHNDFIFAIVGEELGLAGTLGILLLFTLMAIGLYRLVLATDDVFVKIATGGVLIWVVGQALVNVGAVVGLLPVIGVPLPLVSSGGSALVTTLIALGMVLGFARRVPGAPEALASRAGVVRRSLAVLPLRAAAPASRRERR